MKEDKSTVILELTQKEFDLIRLAIAVILDDIPREYRSAATTLIPKFTAELRKMQVPASPSHH